MVKVYDCYFDQTGIFRSRRSSTYSRSKSSLVFLRVFGARHIEPLVSFFAHPPKYSSHSVRAAKAFSTARGFARITIR